MARPFEGNPQTYPSCSIQAPPNRHMINENTIAMNSCTITEQSIAEGVCIILEQKKYKVIFVAILLAFLLPVSFVTWTHSGEGNSLKIGPWDLSSFFTYLVKFIASLAVSSVTFVMLNRIFAEIKNKYVQRMCELWVAANGTMVIQVEGSYIKCRTKNYESCFLVSQIADVLHGGNYVVYIVCDQKKKMTAFFPVPMDEKSFIDAVDKQLGRA